MRYESVRGLPTCQLYLCLRYTLALCPSIEGLGTTCTIVIKEAKEKQTRQTNVFPGNIEQLPLLFTLETFQSGKWVHPDQWRALALRPGPLNHLNTKLITLRAPDTAVSCRDARKEILEQNGSSAKAAVPTRFAGLAVEQGVA
ncbi:hypothetical protein E2C01_014624 [Portunus trituberculatus]|uniref:Uncharacterized protein n=1 Tax=Portunus trituberculatus TaxID=210409 RepID=A0A5B7DJC8_PORTR|nr:hypothetical protein [Portunus trituberculatus]